MRLEIAKELKLISLAIHGCDWRMVTDLLKIDRNSTQLYFQSLSKDRVKCLLYVGTKHREWQYHLGDYLQLFYFVCGFNGLNNVFWETAYWDGQSLHHGPWLWELNRYRYVHHWLARQNRPACFLDKIVNDVFLCLDRLLIIEVNFMLAVHLETTIL